MSAHEVNDAALGSAPFLKEGDVLGGRYAIQECLGVGGMASIFRAVHVGLDQPVAVKVISPEILELPGIVPRFMREARAATRLKGEHVVRVFDVGTTDDGAPYMVMELLEGRDLGAVIDDGFRPSVEEAVDYILQACEALAEVHGLGIVHRDLKPPNLFVTHGPDGLACLKLIDFGISRVDSPLSPHDSVGLTSAEVVMGSPGYMPPEQMESAAAADSRSDIWSLGAIAYELLIGHAPFDGDSLYDIYTAVIHSPPPLPSTLRHDVPLRLDDILLRCLRVDPDERYADVAELARALAELGNEKASARAANVTRVLEASRVRGQSVRPPAPASTQFSSSRGRRLRTGPAFSTAKERRQRTLVVASGIAVAMSLVGLGLTHPVRPHAEVVVNRLAHAPVHLAAAAVLNEAPSPAAAPTPPATFQAEPPAPTSPAVVMPTAWRMHPASTSASRRIVPAVPAPTAEPVSDGPLLRRSTSDVTTDFEEPAAHHEVTDERMLFEERK